VVGLLTVLTAFTLAFASISVAAQAPGRHDFTLGIDMSFIDTSGLPSWTEGSVGKLRYDGDNDGLVFSRAFVDYTGLVSDTLDANIALEVYDDNLGSAFDFTEAYLNWRPVPRSANRYRVKVGAFYPHISLENTEAGWGSPYTMNSSTINTWIAEELRTFGAEFSVSRRPSSLGGRHQFGLQTAIFWNNDPTGSLLAWKGWSAHDRQSRFGDELPLPPLPQIQPGLMFAAQDPYVAPFREVDNRAGYYMSADWRMVDRFLVSVMHYDNRAEPTAIENGQYAWTTKFNHIAAQVSLPANVGLIAQWMRGSTDMGPVMNSAHAVDVDYDSKFLLLTKAVDKHRFSLRYDNFEVTQNDVTQEDNNAEDGHVWTAAYRFGWSESVSVAAEWLSIRTHHFGWVYYDIDPAATEEQIQLSVMFRFSR